MTEYSDSDVKHLALQFSAAKERGRPFALIIGAGCSKSAGVPLARELVAEIHQDKKYAVNLTELDHSQSQNYGSCMSVLDRNLRNDLLGGYLKKAKLNWAHIALASLMKAGYVHRTLSFNFDNILSRACGLCGEYPATYDYATAASNSSDHIVSPAIIHLHGQGTGIVMLNSREETIAHADRIEPLLRDTMVKSPILVVGYSGYTDAVFDKLKLNYDGRERLYWCDFDKTPRQHVLEFLNDHPQLVKHYGGVNADHFLVRLAQELNCFPPAVFAKPLQHLREEIGDVLPFTLSEDSGVDILAKLQIRLDVYEKLEEIHQRESPPDISSTLIEMLLKGNTEGIIRWYEANHTNSGQIPVDVIAEAYFSEALKTRDPELKVRLNEEAAKLAPLNCSVMNSWGISLASLGEKRDRLDMLEQACERFQQAVAIKPDFSHAYMNWGRTLCALAKKRHEPQLLEQASKKFELAAAAMPGFYPALVAWGNSLTSLAKTKSDTDLLWQASEKFQQVIGAQPEDYVALACWGEVLEFISEVPHESERLDQEIRKLTQAIPAQLADVRVLSGLGYSLLMLGENLDRLDLLEQACETYRLAIDNQPDRYEALDNWGYALTLLGQKKNNLDLLEQACEKHENVVAINSRHAKAYVNWGNALLYLGMKKDRLDLLELCCEKCEQAIAIQPDKAAAFANWGTSLALLGEKQNRTDLLELACEKLEQAIAIKPDLAEAILSWGHALCILGQIKSDHDLTQQACNKYKDASRLMPGRKDVRTNLVESHMQLIGQSQCIAHLEDAKEVVEEAATFDPTNAYNAACIAALMKDEECCRKHLQACKQAGTLPSFQHIETDADLSCFKNECWFRDLLQFARK